MQERAIAMVLSGKITWQPQEICELLQAWVCLKPKLLSMIIPTQDAFNLKDREVAHAPEYSFATSVQYDSNRKSNSDLRG